MAYRRVALVVGVVAASGCGGSSGGPDAGSGVDAPGGGCDRARPFGALQSINELSDGDQDHYPRLTADELMVVYSTDTSLFVATRASRSAPFDPPQPLQIGGSDADGWVPALSTDGLTLYFSTRPSGTQEIFVTRRAVRTDPFPAATRVVLGTGGSEDHPFLTVDRSELWFTSDQQVWRATLDPTGAVTSAAAVPELAPGGGDWLPTLTDDGRELYFASSRSATDNYDIFVARRASASDPFGTPELVSELSTAGYLARDLPGWLTPDGCRMYLSRSTTGTTEDLYYADRGL